MNRYIFLFFITAQAIPATPVYSQLPLWKHFAAPRYWTDPVAAREGQEFLAFGLLHWTGGIHIASDYQPDIFICTYNNFYQEGPAFGANCYNDNGTRTSGPCREPTIASVCGADGTGTDETVKTSAGTKAGGNPASLNTGQKFETVDDWVSPKDARFRLSRTYRTSFSTIRDLGLVWQSNWSDQLRLLFPAIKMRRIRSNGDRHEFTDPDGAFDGTGNWQRVRPDTALTLTESNYIQTVTHGDGMVETFQPRASGTTWLYSELIRHAGRQRPELVLRP